jgi:hypothetical protein
MTCTLGMTCSTGAIFIALTSLPVVSPRRVCRGGKTEGREIPHVSFLPIGEGLACREGFT